MPEPHDDDQQDLVLDCVDDAVVAYPDTKTRPTREGTCSWGSRIVREQRNRALEATTNVRIELAQGPGCRRTQFDAIDGHCQPRSALT